MPERTCPWTRATADSIQADFARAIELLKQLPDEDTRAKAHVYMEGLAEMQSEWGGGRRDKPRKREP